MLQAIGADIEESDSVGEDIEPIPGDPCARKLKSESDLGSHGTVRLRTIVMPVPIRAEDQSSGKPLH